MFVFLMLVLVAAFGVAVMYLAKVAVLQFEQEVDGDVFRVKEGYLDIIRQKDELAEEKARLQMATERIFNLYDLMRELTRTQDAAEAFRTFKDHVHRQMPLDDCLLVENYLRDIMDFPLFEGYKLFPLKSKRKVLGELAYKGLKPEDEEAFSILAQQFALALRRIRLCKEQEDLASTDGLTRLYTRRYFQERFDEEITRSKAKGLPLSVLMIDVDHFKRVNDDHGHLAGDQVLREIGRQITLGIREIDIASRLGGEEFCIILPETEKNGALVVAERIREAVHAGKIRTYDLELCVSVSIGVATFSEDASQKDELLDKADWALYRAKKMGRNRVVGFRVYGEQGGIPLRQPSGDETGESR